MTHSHNPVLLALAVVIAALAAGVAFAYVRQAGRGRGRERAAWLAGGAAALGLGTWAMHFVGMLGYRLIDGRAPVPVSFALWPMLAALGVATAGAAASLGLLARWRGGPVLAGVAAGLVHGASIVWQHYVAMSAMRLAAQRSYDPAVVLVAVGVALGGALAAFGLAWRSRPEATSGLAPAVRAAPAVLALTIPATHYAAMASVRFQSRGGSSLVEPGSVLATEGLAAVVVIATVLVLGLAGLAVAQGRTSRTRLQAAEEYAALYEVAETARRAAEESEQRFRATADAAPALIWMADAGGRWTYVNAAGRRYTGRTPGEAPDDPTGGAWATDVHPADAGARRASYARAFAEREPYHLEYRLRSTDGAYRWFLESAAPRWAEGGAFAGLVGLCVDITARKEAERTQALLVEASRRFGEAALDAEAIVDHLTAVLVPGEADLCVVRLVEADGTLRQAAAVHADPSRQPLLDELGRLFAPARGDPRTPLAEVLGAGVSALRVPPAPDDLVAPPLDAALGRVSAALGVVSSVTVALAARPGNPLGTLTLAATGGRRGEEPREYDVHTVRRAELLAGRAALAIENARLYGEAERARAVELRAAELRAELAQARLDALRAQLDPHFLFNALNTVAMLVRREARDDALQGIVALSGLLRRVLDGAGAATATVGEELAIVEHYLEVERLRFRDRLQARVDVPQPLHGALVPSLVLQPLVENAVRHGAGHASKGGVVQIRGRREDGSLVLEVQDDGPGFPKLWNPHASDGLGLRNTRERLTHTYGAAARLEIEDPDAGGALVRIVVPIRFVDPPEPG